MLPFDSIIGSMPDLFAMFLIALICLFLGIFLSYGHPNLLNLDLFDRVVLLVVTGIIAISWLGTILASLGLFYWPLMVISALAIIVWVQWHSPREPQPPGTTRQKANLLWRAQTSDPPIAFILLAALMLMISWLFARPTESFMVNDDAAVYTLGGLALANNGSLLFSTGVVADHPVRNGHTDQQADIDAFNKLLASQSDIVNQFYMFEYSSIVPARHYGPFYQWSLTQRAVEIGFLPLPKVWVGIMAWLFGPSRAIVAAPFMGLVSVIVLYGMARQIGNWRTGFFAALFMGISLPQVWFSRLGLSEIYSQAAVLGSVYLLLLARRSSSIHARQRLTILSALMLASLTILRLEAVIIISVFAVLLGLAGWADDSWRSEILKPWLVTLALSASVGTVLSMAVAPYYIFTRIIMTVSPGTIQLGLIGFLATVAGGLLAYYRYREQLNKRLSNQPQNGVVMLTRLAWIAWLLVVIWQMATRAQGETFPGWITQYWGFTGLALSLAGVLWVLPSTGRNEAVVLSGLSAFFLLIYSLRPLVMPVHPWAMRRTVPVIWPVLALGAALLLEQGLPRIRMVLSRHVAHRLANGLVTAGKALLAIALALGLMRQTISIAHHRDHDGLWAQLAGLSERLPSDALLLFDDGPIGQRLPQVMEIIFGHPSFVLRSTGAIRSESPAVDRLISNTMQKGRPVYLIKTGEHLDWRPVTWKLSSWGGQRFSMPVLRHAWGRVPVATDIGQQVFWVDIYEIQPMTVEAAYASKTDIPIGLGSHPYLIQGFHSLEVDEERVFRWTDGNALVYAPWPADTSESPATFCLSLSLLPFREPGIPAPELVIQLEDEILYREIISENDGLQTIAIEANGVQNKGRPELEIRINSDRWTPALHNEQSGDERTLGIMLFGMRIASGECAP